MKHYYLLLLLSLCCVGCGPVKLIAPCRHPTATHAAQPRIDLRDYVVQIDGNGVLETHPQGVCDDLLGGKETRRRKELENDKTITTQSYLDTMFSHLNRPGRRPKHIIVFANGGLNGYRSSMGRATQVLTDQRGHVAMSHDTAFMFISWNSGLNSYLEHLATHQGVVTPGGWGWFGKVGWGVLNATADLGRAAISAPLLFGQYYTQAGVGRVGLQRTNNLYRADLQQPDDLHKEHHQMNWQASLLRTAYVADAEHRLKLELGESKRRGSFPHFYLTPAAISVPTVLTWTGTLPWGWAFTNTRLVSFVVADAIGRPAWNSMLRRTQVMFVKPKPANTARNQLGNSLASLQQQSQRAKGPNSGDARTSTIQMERGVVPQFIDHLKDYQQQRLKETKDTVTVTLMGHSMGTIIVSEILRDELHRPDGPHLLCDNVVFLAAACPLRDVRTKVVPYMQEHNNTKFFNLTLHPYAEVAENMLPVPFVKRKLGGFLLDGSLLVYIDRLLTNPLTPQERTAGRWYNFVLATTDTSFIPAKVQSRVTLKGFGAGTRTLDGPQCHTDFGTPFLTSKEKKKGTVYYPHRFWSREFRTVSKPSQTLGLPGTGEQ